MLILVKLNPEYSRYLLVQAKGTCALFLFLLAEEEKAVIVSFRWDTKILTADRTAGSAAVCKEGRRTLADFFVAGQFRQAWDKIWASRAIYYSARSQIVLQSAVDWYAVD